MKTETPFSELPIPENYDLTRDGVFDCNEESPSQLTLSPIWISAIVRTPDSKGWAGIVHIINMDGCEHVQIIPYSTISEMPKDLRHLFSTLGLFIAPGGDRALATYLSNFFSLDLPQKTIYSKKGWDIFCTNPDSHIEPVFLLPERTLTRPAVEHLAQDIFLYSGNDTNASLYASSGTLADWKTGISPYHDHPLIVFSVLAALAAPFAHLVGASNSIFHFYGHSTTGKTTALQAGASVWGIGRDPQHGTSLVGSWNTTINALEILLAKNSGMVTLLDELGIAGELSSVIYQIAGGVGKKRMTKEASLQAEHQWNTTVVSTGEISLQAKLELERGQPLKAGELVRAIDIPVESLAPTQSIAMEEMRQRMDALKQLCAQHYGSAGPALITALLQEIDSHAELEQSLRSDTKTCNENLQAELAAAGYQLQPIHLRALLRMGLVLAIGLHGIEREILPFTEEDVLDAVVAVCKAWLDQVPPLSEGEQGIEYLRSYISQNQAQILDSEDFLGHPWPLGGAQIAINHKGRLLFTEVQFSQACGNASPRTVLQALKDKGLLHCEPGKSKLRVTVGEKERYAFFAVDWRKLLGTTPIAAFSDVSSDPHPGSFVPPRRRTEAA